MEEVTLLDFNAKRGEPAAADRAVSEGGHVLLRQPVHRARRAVGHARAEARPRASSRSSWPKELDARGRGPRRLPAGRRSTRSRSRRSIAANGVDPKQPERVLGFPEPRVLAAAKAAWREDRKPANVLLVLDVSGSMGDENRLERAKDGLDVFLRNVAPQDRVGLLDLQRPGPAAAPDHAVPGDQRRAAQHDPGPDRRRRDGDLRRGDRGASRTCAAASDRDRINAVVLLTDGEDTDSGASFEDAERDARVPGRLVQPRARVHDRLQRRRRRRRGAARGARRSQRRQELRGLHRGHRVRLPLDLSFF